MNYKFRKWGASMAIALCVFAIGATTHGLSQTFLTRPPESRNSSTDKPAKITTKKELLYSWTFSKDTDNGWEIPNDAEWNSDGSIKVSSSEKAIVSPEIDLSGGYTRIKCVSSRRIICEYTVDGENWIKIDGDNSGSYTDCNVPIEAKHLRVVRTSGLASLELYGYRPTPFNGDDYGRIAYQWSFMENTVSGWDIPDNVSYNDGKNNSDYKGAMTVTDTIVSPEIDLSSCTTPLLRIDKYGGSSYNVIEYSHNGADWYTLRNVTTHLSASRRNDTV